MLQMFNSLSGEKLPFTPRIAGKIGMYVCGITVYDYCHIGHGRTFVAFDVIARYLRFSGFDLTYVRNITDIDDKIIARAASLNQDWRALVAHFVDEMDADFAALNIAKPDQEPRATQQIDAIMAMIDSLLAQDKAYVAKGDVYFRVNQFAPYGRLSRQPLDSLKIGARVEANELKQDPLDFALWKSAKPGEPSWQAPWGEGRPGWHIECSAMSKCCLGASFDIHGGGSDLIFPHHENEIAQSEAANGQHYANVWLHSGMVNVDEQKMSKSLNNFFTIRDVLNQWHPEVVRYFLTASHYRSQISYSQQLLQAAQASLTRLYTALQGVEPGELAANDAYLVQFKAAMDDDFNVPEALAVLFELARDLNRAKLSEPTSAPALAARLRQLGAVLGLLVSEPEAFLQRDAGLSTAEIEQQIQQRLAAKAAKDWALADAIRQQLLAQGIVLEDSAQGSSWRRA